EWRLRTCRATWLPAHEGAEFGSGRLKRPSPALARTRAQGGLTRSGPPHAEYAKRTWSWMQRGTFAGCSAMRRFSTAESRTDDSNWRQHPRPYARGLFVFSCQLLANACVAASRVALKPCVRERSSS